MSTSIQMSDRLSSLYERLLLTDFRRKIFNLPHDEFSPEELSVLISEASHLSLAPGNSLSEAAAACQIAYDIVTRIGTIASAKMNSLAPLCALILSRVGNFPARELMKEFNGGRLLTLPPILELENVVRIEENSTETGAVLTDFQVKLLDSLRTSQYVSVSAPTSAGKSFTLELDLVNRLKDAESYVAIFLVPTRALIRQVTIDLNRSLQEHEIQASVLSSISIPEFDPEKPHKFIFVLTQERFGTLLSDVPDYFSIDAIVVDEAQEIGKPKRGVTLERVIKSALRLYPDARLFFSSPLRSNPEYLLDIFGKNGDRATSFIEFQRPVSQSIFFLTQVPRTPEMAKIDVLLDDKRIHLETVSLPFRFRDRYIANIVRHFTAAEDTSIVYCNQPAEANKVAEEIAEISGELHDSTLSEFAAFLKQEVHDRYKLAHLVQRGVSFHYANIPQIIRARIEELAKDRKIRFVCCTSTLLQGVNLPAKNIFVENPKLGRGEAGRMSTGEFWNLIGRAGRMRAEFSGNVFCVYGKKWESNPFVGERLAPIESAFHVALTERIGELAIWASNPPDSADGGEAWAEQAYANVYADYLVEKRPLRERSLENADMAAVDRIDLASIRLTENRTLPEDIFFKNLYVHPQRLEDLASIFRSADNLAKLLPPSPYSENAWDSLYLIFGLIDQVFIKSKNDRHRYFSFLALRWMRGDPVSQLVESRLKYKKIEGANDKVINDEIGDLFEEIENDIRFRYVKYMTMYIQVLRAVLMEKGMTPAAESILPMHVFLEFGAFDSALINLMSLGLSRTSALLLKKKVSFPPSMSMKDCREYLRVIALDRIDLPVICKAEILRLRGRTQ